MNIPGLSVNTLADCDAASASSSGDGTAITGVTDSLAGLTFGIGTTAPTYVASSAINGLPAMRFQPVQGNYQSNFIALTIPSGLTFNGQNGSVYMVARGINSSYGASDGNALFALGAGATAGHPCFYTSQGMFGLNIQGADYRTTQLTAVAENVGIYAVRFGSTTATVTADGQNQTVTISPATSITGGFIGNVYGSGFQYPFNGEIYRVLFFNSALGSTDHNTLMAYLSNKYGVATWNSQLTLGCESNMMAEYSVTSTYLNYGQSPAAQALQLGLLSPQTKCVNLGIAGISVKSLTSGWYTNLLNTSLTGLGGHIIVMEGGWNDLATGDSPAQVLTTHQTFGQTCRNAGIRYVVLGIPDSAPYYGHQANAASLTALLAANWPTFADAYIPVPTQLTNYANTTYFIDNPNGLHLTAAGQLAWANAIAPVVNRVLNLAGVGLFPSITTSF